MTWWNEVVEEHLQWSIWCSLKFVLGEDFWHLLSLARFLSFEVMIIIDHFSEITKVVGRDKIILNQNFWI